MNLQLTIFTRTFIPLLQLLVLTLLLNASITDATMPHIGINDESKIVPFTQSLNTTDTIILNESIGATSSVTHVLKGTATGNTSMSGFLIFTPTVGDATETAEYFKDEATWRITSGSYDSQVSVSTGSWNSQTHMTGTGKFMLRIADL